MNIGAHLMSSQPFGPKGRLFAVSLGLMPWLAACGGGDAAKKVLVIGLDGVFIGLGQYGDVDPKKRIARENVRVPSNTPPRPPSACPVQRVRASADEARFRILCVPSEPERTVRR